MAPRIDYISQTRNQVVVKYTSDGAGADSTIFLGPTAFGAATGPDAVTGLTYSSAALKKVLYGVYDSGVTGKGCSIIFNGSTNYVAFAVPRGAGQLDFERFTINNLAVGSTGMVTFTNPGVTATVIAAFVTH